MIKNRNQVGSRLCARIGAASAVWALLATPAVGQWGESEGPEVNVTDYGTVDLAVQDTDLAQVLEMLSIQGRKNIITSKNVSATVSANLYDVTFYEALDAILSVNGYGYMEKGNFIYIYTQEELAEAEAAARTTESRIIALEYLSATDANEFIAPLLSDVGKASARGEVQPGFQPDVGDGGADSYAYEAKIVVNDYPENLESITNLLAELDTPPQQVLIEAAVLQTTLSETNAFGVDFAAIADFNFTDLTGPLSPISNLLDGADATTGFQPADNRAHGLQSTPGNTSAPGTFKLGIVTDEISVFLNLLDEVTDTMVLARPKIMTLNRQRAEVLVGERVGYLSTTTTQTTTTQTVQFLDTGIQLVLRPFISKNGMIRMELSPSVSEAEVKPVTDVSGNTVTVPNEVTSEMTTNVRIRDGQTLVMGGLFKEDTTVTRRQVPWLGDIPLLGAAFRGQDDTVVRTEIIFLITPSIVHDEILWEIGDNALSAGDAIRLGSRRGLLPFSRERMTAGYNLKAMEAFRAGKLNMALHWAATSLNQNPNQPEMIMLRGELSGERERSFDRSLLDRSMRHGLGALPRETAELPREISARGVEREAPLNWLPDLNRRPDTGPARRSTERPADMDDEPMDDEDESDEPVSLLDDARHPVTNHLPRINAARGFWPAGDSAAGFDDPSWEQAVPFVTFEDIPEMEGGNDKNSM